MSQICTGFGNTIVLEQKGAVKKISGRLDAQGAPGDILYASANGVFSRSAGSTAAQVICGVLEYRPRTAISFSEVDIDTTYTDYTRYNVEMIIGPRDGTLMVAAKCVDPAAAMYYGHQMIPSSGGKLKVLGAMWSSQTLGIVTEYGLENGSTVGRFYLVNKRK